MTTNHCHHEYNVNRDKRAGGEKNTEWVWKQWIHYTWVKFYWIISPINCESMTSWQVLRIKIKLITASSSKTNKVEDPISITLLQTNHVNQFQNLHKEGKEFEINNSQPTGFVLRRK